MRVAGADVWKGRWVLVTLADGRFDRACVVPTFRELVALVPDAVAIGVDIPIGLPELGHQRPADALARAFVGPRRQSLFPVHPRAVLLAGSLSEANERSRASGGPGVSAQSYALAKMVLDVEPIAATDARVHEVHPEGSFVEANGGLLLEWAKSSWNGVALRRRILRDQGIDIPSDLGAAGRAGVADVLDATAVAWSAARIAAGHAASLPAGHGRIGAIWR